MKSTIAELCNRAQEYLLSIKVQNKNAAYNPKSTLKAGGSLKTFYYKIQCPDKNKAVTQTAQINVFTNENIPASYIAAVTDAKIISDWVAYRDKYIYTRIQSSTYISLSSMFLFLYLFRYFVDKKFCLFTDIYTMNSDWLYNTAAVTYNPSGMNINLGELDAAAMDSYMDTLITEIATRENLKTLVASSSHSSSSSSSSSSSCSSSCSSSSCSCSSSSSSLFIAYFNLG